ncbi:hypothetical protein [Paractinoplanes brasiliensis]|uniref:Uncharacterized protein n=1 Tax=Paractinoplanes brasiliensis TaxID=52695 RepID=A0A4R6JW48_9ACTN|nr:hypothetical protein [Actinoplanes brasiliensis]TDO39406.1 hypothetical protein C8E87_3091 [Actinoplanes brasiliensis]GID32696.1 hypothetical protein Abr02nite_76790 [Actinoplanes brasiliensis]
MNGVQDLLINIIAAVIVFLAGVGVRGLVGFARSWRGRAFWGRTMLHGRTYLLVGALTRFKHLEPTDFVGGGDSRAVHELATMIGKLGSSFEVTNAGRITDGLQRENLILLGLEQVNTLVPNVFEKIGVGYEVDVPSMTITDRVSGETYTPQWEIDLLQDNAARDLDGSWFIHTDQDGVRSVQSFRIDYGILVRGQNPYAPKRGLVVMAGLYGFGTWAAARLPLDEEFLRLCAGFRNFECLFRVEVHQEIILSTSIISIRSLPDLTTKFDLEAPSPRPSTDSVTPRTEHEPAEGPPTSRVDDRPGH